MCIFMSMFSIGEVVIILMVAIRLHMSAPILSLHPTGEGVSGRVVWPVRGRPRRPALPRRQGPAHLQGLPRLQAQQGLRARQALHARRAVQARQGMMSATPNRWRAPCKALTARRSRNDQRASPTMA